MELRWPYTPEEWVDFTVSAGWLVVLFAGLLTVPRGWLWLFLVVWTAFWLRFNYVQMKRELLIGDGGECPASGDGSQGRVGLPERSQEIAIAGKDSHSRVEPPRIVRRQ